MVEPGTGTAAPQPSDFEILDGTLVKYRGNDAEVVVPEGVRVIGPTAFQGNRLTSLTLPSSLRRIEQQAFYLCFQLTSIRFAEGLEFIGRMAFCECHSLMQLSLPQSLHTIEAMAFSACGLLGFLDIPDGVRRVEEKAFSYCPWLTSIIFHGEPASYALGAFEDCQRLRRICGPQSLIALIQASGLHPDAVYLPPMGDDTDEDLDNDPGDKTGG